MADNSRVLSAPLIIEYPFSRTTGPVIGAFLTGLREKVLIGIRGSDGTVIVEGTAENIPDPVLAEDHGVEPDFTLVITALTGACLKLSKAGVALVDLNLQKGKLLWLFPPKFARNAK